MKRSSALSLVTLGLLFGLLILVMIPQFVKSRVAGSAHLIFNLRVVDSETKPIPGAHVILSRAYDGPRSGITDSAGEVSLKKAFMASGRGQLTHCRLDSSLRIEAGGYEPWETSLGSLLGAHYDFSKHGTIINQTVTVARAKQAKAGSPTGGDEPIRAETNAAVSGADSRR